MEICIIDNYDSFTYNLAHAVKSLGVGVTVLRNDRFKLEDLEKYDKLILSPGPGIPSEAGLLLDVVKSYAGRKPMLGVCLGEQAIGEAFGAKLVNLKDVSRENFPACLEITAVSKDGCIMGLRHRTMDVHGIQFHPESVLTPDGITIISNFINHK